jgi:hypothetical protein
MLGGGAFDRDADPFDAANQRALPAPGRVSAEPSAGHLLYPHGERTNQGISMFIGSQLSGCPEDGSGSGLKGTYAACSRCGNSTST